MFMLDMWICKYYIIYYIDILFDFIVNKICTYISHKRHNLWAHHYHQQIVSAMPQSGHFNDIYGTIILLNIFMSSLLHSHCGGNEKCIL